MGEACALCNLGNCHSSLGQFGQAVPFYENYLMLSQVNILCYRVNSILCPIVSYMYVRFMKADRAIIMENIEQDNVNFGTSNAKLEFRMIYSNNLFLNGTNCSSLIFRTEDL